MLSIWPVHALWHQFPWDEVTEEPVTPTMTRRSSCSSVNEEASKLPFDYSVSGGESQLLSKGSANTRNSESEVVDRFWSNDARHPCRCPVLTATLDKWTKKHKFQHKTVIMHGRISFLLRMFGSFFAERDSKLKKIEIINNFMQFLHSFP